MAEYFFDLSASLIIICLIFAFYLNKYQRMSINRIALVSMICLFDSAIAGVFFCITKYTVFAVFASIFSPLCLGMLLIYIYKSCAYKIVRLVVIFTVILPVLLAVAAGVASCFIDNEVIWWASKIANILLVMFGTFYLIRFRENTAIERIFLLTLAYFMVISSYVVSLVMPHIDYEAFAISILMAQIFLGLRNPDELYDVNTGLMGIEGFRDIIRKRLAYIEKNPDQHMYIVTLSLHGLDSFAKLMGDKNSTLHWMDVVTELTRFTHIASLYRIDKGLYAFILEKGDRDEAEYVMRKLDERMKLPFGRDDYEANVQYTLSIIDAPEMADSLTSVLNAVKMIALEGEKKNLNIIRYEDLDFDLEKRLHETEEKVRNAVADGKLEVFYQPIYSAKEKRYVSAEALIRLHDGDNFISPELFIPVAESNGYVVEIDDFVIQQVCKMIAGRKIEKLGLKYIELNLSGSDMIQSDLAEKLQRFIRMYSIHPSQLNLEITETSADAFTGIVEDNVIKLSHMGFNFSLDDFGTGYSSLSRVIMLPFDIIKLDKTIVQPPFMLEDEVERENARKLLESSVEMVSRVGAKMVAEGVETKEQFEALEKLGVDHIQGYYFSRPLPEAEFINVVKEMNKKAL